MKSFHKQLNGPFSHLLWIHYDPPIHFPVRELFDPLRHIRNLDPDYAIPFCLAAVKGLTKIERFLKDSGHEGKAVKPLAGPRGSYSANGNDRTAH
jgi:hypothetical protein